MTFLKKLLILGIILTLSAAAKTVISSREPTPGQDEILLDIYPHVRDDVFLMEASFSIDGHLVSSAGACNANMRSPLRDSVYFHLLPEDFPEGADFAKLSVSLAVQNEPFPSADGTAAMNTAQARLIPVRNEIFLPAAAGEQYVLVLREQSTDRRYYLTVLKGALLSPDGRYSAKAAFENKFLAKKTMVEITIHDTWGLEPDFVFSPVRSLDFWGLFWDGSRLAVDSSDVGMLYYEKDDAGQWSQAPQVHLP